jgi:hypothetical protein
MIDAVSIYLPGKKKPAYHIVGDIFPNTNGDKLTEIQRLENGVMLVTKEMKMKFCGFPYITYEIRNNPN